MIEIVFFFFHGFFKYLIMICNALIESVIFFKKKIYIMFENLIWFMRKMKNNCLVEY